jgi:hypothetical protein
LAEIKHLLPYLFNDSKYTFSFKVEYERGNKLTNFEIEKP